MKRIRVLIDEQGHVTEHPMDDEPEKKRIQCPCGCGTLMGEDERPTHYTGQYL